MNTRIIRLWILAITLLFSPCVFAQRTIDWSAEWKSQILSSVNLDSKEYKDSLIHKDFVALWISTDSRVVYGFIGDNYQRIRMKIISAVKDTANTDTYYVTGKSMVKDIVCAFTGTIKITSIRINKNMHGSVDEDLRNLPYKKQGVLICEYHFFEDSTQVHSGYFEGIAYSLWYIDKNGQLKYDDIEKFSDSFRNNQFVGSWKGYHSTLKKTCNWGDYRAPFCGDLDVGEGEFSPNDKYLSFGWQSHRDAYSKNIKEARQVEGRAWWK
jgi:hypothetical protein